MLDIEEYLDVDGRSPFAEPGSIVLLGGGSKRRQEHDIRKAKWRWKEYRRRQHEE